MNENTNLTHEPMDCFVLDVEVYFFSSMPVTRSCIKVTSVKGREISAMQLLATPLLAL